MLSKLKLQFTAFLHYVNTHKLKGFDDYVIETPHLEDDETSSTYAEELYHRFHEMKDAVDLDDHMYFEAAKEAYYQVYREANVNIGRVMFDDIAFDIVNDGNMAEKAMEVAESILADDEKVRYWFPTSALCMDGKGLVQRNGSHEKSFFSQSTSQCSEDRGVILHRRVA